VLIGWQHRLAAMPTRSWANLHLNSSGGLVTPNITGIRWGGPAEDEIDALVDAVGRQPSSRRTWSETHAGSVGWFEARSATLQARGEGFEPGLQSGGRALVPIGP
jgi:hypothetical protein